MLHYLVISRIEQDCELGASLHAYNQAIINKSP